MGFLLLRKKSKIESIYGDISFDFISMPPILKFLKSALRHSIICMMAAESHCLSNKNSVVELI